MAREQTAFDELHDEFHQHDSRKAGTRYEVLSALVLKLVSENCMVIHDRSLAGSSTVVRQIDVTIDRDGNDVRTVVECKDDDISKEKVGQPVIDAFVTKVQDLGADEGVFISNIGFTKPALKVAAHFGIKLVVLRLSNAVDEEGRVKQIDVEIVYCSPVHVGVQVQAGTVERCDALKSAAREAGLGSLMSHDAPVVIATCEGRERLIDYAHKVASKNCMSHSQAEGFVNVHVPLDQASLVIGEAAPIEVESLTVQFAVENSRRAFSIVADEIARLVLQGFGDDDLLVLESDLRRYRLNGEGEVISADD